MEPVYGQGESFKILVRECRVAGVVNYIYCRPWCRGDPANWFSPFIPATLTLATAAAYSRSQLLVITPSPPLSSPQAAPYFPPLSPPSTSIWTSPCVLIQSSESQLPVCRIFCQLVKLQFLFSWNFQTDCRPPWSYFNFMILDFCCHPPNSGSKFKYSVLSILTSATHVIKVLI